MRSTTDGKSRFYYSLERLKSQSQYLKGSEGRVYLHEGFFLHHVRGRRSVRGKYNNRQSSTPCPQSRDYGTPLSASDVIFRPGGRVSSDYAHPTGSHGRASTAWLGQTFFFGWDLSRPSEPFKH